ncbi:DUF4352 domain-containing protein [Psychrobacillus sp. FJAT-21963]|uniref:DUF4352 domain-containing protein n=1 Tax=Psychrobacillus sp. FJAT-21963 TaxID=1712028 RepID=UPI0006FBD04C|nr:DUF4352 domain-containing protein [Psychrobacillus sp. FJAT-21963]KQL37101.1 hypothetical protein AN959_03395 [Psychrobacillus sp. FJAT-21963]
MNEKVKKKGGCLKLFLIVFGILVLISACTAALTANSPENDEEKKTETSTESTSNSMEGEKVEVTSEKVIAIGEELKVGDVAFKVNEFSETKEVTAGNGMFKYTPDAEGAIFLVVNVTLRNDGKEMINTDSSFFQLKAGDIKYSPSSILVADEKFFVFEGINPGLGLTGNILFEVPPSLTGLELQVQTGFWGTETGLIKLN